MSWDQHLQKFQSLDEDDPAKLPMGRAFLDALGKEFLQGHQIVENQTDGELEMRAAWHGFPVRAKIDANFGLIEWEMRAPNPTGTTLFLRFDEDAIPKVGSFTGAASAWDDDADAEEKVFFGRGYFVVSTRAELPRVLAVLAALPAEVQGSLARFMVGDKISKLYAYDRGSLLLTWSDGLHELGDAYNKAARGAWLMGQLAHGLARVSPAGLPAAGAPSAQAGYVATCRHCQTRFVLTQSAACPNCGAPPR
jgi:hypothetical protein